MIKGVYFGLLVCIALLSFSSASQFDSTDEAFFEEDYFFESVPLQLSDCEDNRTCLESIINQTDCNGDSLCKHFQKNLIDEILASEIYLERPREITKSYEEGEPSPNQFSGSNANSDDIPLEFYDRFDSDESIIDTSIEISYSSETTRLQRKQNWYDFLLDWVRSIEKNLRSNKITGNLISEKIDASELPDLPPKPQGVDSVIHPKISKSKFKVFNFFTGNAIIGIPQWSFDGEDYITGNFVFNALHIKLNDGLDHFDLNFNVNNSKIDSNGNMPVNGIIFQTGYYLNENEGRWVDFNWTGNKIFSTNNQNQNEFTGWLRETSSASLTLENFTSNDYAIFLGYSCLKFFEQSWECNEGKWVLFVVETGSTDYHSNISDGPTLQYQEVADLDLTDIPSILRQFNVSQKDFEPEFSDLFVGSINNDINTEVNTTQDLHFVLRNFGNTNISYINYSLDIGESRLLDVVSAKLPKSLLVNETKTGVITIYTKEEHFQTLTLFARTGLEVDSSDNLATYNLNVGTRPNIEDIPPQSPYNISDELIYVYREPFESSSYENNTELTLLSGTDKIRTIYGGYWGGKSINPTMEVTVGAKLSEEAFYSRPYASAIVIKGSLLTGERENVDYKIRFINNDSGVYYETPVLQSSYEYGFNPKQLIPDFEFCNLYVTQVILTGANQETIDVIEPETFTLCDFEAKIGGEFEFYPIRKNGQTYVTIFPKFNSRYYETLNISYIVQFSGQDGIIYNTPKFQGLDKISFVPLQDLFRGASYDFVKGQRFQGKAILFEPLDPSRRNCATTYNNNILKATSNVPGLQNWELFDSNRTLSDRFLCYDDMFYFCDVSSNENFDDLTAQRSNVGDVVGKWECNGNSWIPSEKTDFQKSLGTEQTRTIHYTKTIIDCSGDLDLYTKNDEIIMDPSLVFNKEPNLILPALGQNLSALLSSLPQGTYEGLEHGNYYFLCEGSLDIQQENHTSEIVFYEGSSSSLSFKWNDWDVVTRLLSSLTITANPLSFRVESNSIVYSGIDGSPRIGDFKYVQGRGASLPYKIKKNAQIYLVNNTKFLYNLIDLETGEKVIEDRLMTYDEYDVTTNLDFYLETLSADDFVQMKNGRFYMDEVTAHGPYSSLFPKGSRRFYYIDGHNFILNNLFVYSRFFGLDNYVSTIESRPYPLLNEKNIPKIDINYRNVNVVLNVCSDKLEKVDISRRYIDYTDPCYYPAYGHYLYDGSRKPIFDDLEIVIYPVDNDTVDYERADFNCKIGKYDGVCHRSDYGSMFYYLDNRTGLIYQISLDPKVINFIKQYNDASANSTRGNYFDLVLYDILSQIEKNPIRDFEIDFSYPKRNRPNIEYEEFIEGGPFFASENGITLNYPIDTTNTPSNNMANIYNNSFDLITSVNITELVDYQYDDTLLDALPPGSLETGLYFAQYDGFSRASSFYWINNYTYWFTDDPFKNRYLDIPDNQDVTYVNSKFTPLERSTDYGYGDPNKLTFYYSISPVNLLPGEFSRVGLKNQIDLLLLDYEGFFYNSKPSYRIIKGYNISRSYGILEETYDDIYEFYQDAPLHCENTLENNPYSNVVCRTSNSQSLFFTCYWSNIDELKIYRLSMTQSFGDDSINIGTLPSLVIEDAKNDFFFPVIDHYLGLLPETPILNSSFSSTSTKCLW